MPYVSTNGIRLAYERVGRGERVVMGQAAGGNVWSMYQVPALKAAVPGGRDIAWRMGGLRAGRRQARPR